MSQNFVSEMSAATLEQALQELEEKNFFDANSLKLSEVMRWSEGQTLYSWSEELLRFLAPFLGGLQATLYYADNAQTHLSLAGSYAVTQSLRRDVMWGEGLLGQVAKGQEFILLENLDERHFANTSGTLQLRPTTIVVMPLVYNTLTCGVLEISLLNALQPRLLSFLKRSGESIAASLNGLVKEKELQDSFKRIQENEDRFRRLAEVTLEGIVFVKNGIITETNTVFAEMFGYKGYEVLHKSLQDFLAEGNFIKHAEKPVEYVGLRKDGSTFPVEIQKRDVSYKGEKLRVATFLDITERKKVQEELRNSEAQLAEAQKIVNLMDIIEKKNKNIMASINYARKIQNAILPDTKLIDQTFAQNFIFYRCKDVVSGDFYYFRQTPDNHTVMAAVDCTGHGVPGAFMSLIGYTQLNYVVEGQKLTSPAQVLLNLDAAVVKALRQDADPTSKDGMDVAICCVNETQTQLQYAGANRPLYLIRDGQLIETKGDKFPIGGTYHKQGKQFTNHTFEIQSGDTFYLFSDGYVDQFSENNEKYMSKRFRQFLLQIAPHDMATQQQLIAQEFEQWKGNAAQLDDVLVIGLRF